MATQASELPAGRESMSQRWCYFCDHRGQSTKGSRRGKKKVRFFRCRRTQPGHGRGFFGAHDGSPSAYYFPGGRLLLPRR